MASCSCAAGRCTSSEASNTFLRFCPFRRLAIFAAVVVLPEPCSPTSMTATGEGAFRSMPLVLVAPSPPPGPPPGPPPSISTRWSWTILTTICAGVTDRSTSCPSAFSRTAATKSLTTGSATSASSSAIRISRKAVPTSASVSAPWRRSRSNTSPRRSLRLSNIRSSTLIRDSKNASARNSRTGGPGYCPGCVARFLGSASRNVIATRLPVNCAPNSSTLASLNFRRHRDIGDLLSFIGSQSTQFSGCRCIFPAHENGGRGSGYRIPVLMTNLVLQHGLSVPRSL